jgi:hypothetical protein
MTFYDDFLMTMAKFVAKSLYFTMFFLVGVWLYDENYVAVIKNQST